MELLKSIRADNVDLPLFIVVKNNAVYFVSEGYRVGIGEQLIKTIKKTGLKNVNGHLQPVFYFLISPYKSI
ncbi:MAG: hypothetical protein MZV63_37880 [Marinilabiliales bacterium]|nr:hypothetical protein [Marinilabiliales bacterium]